MPVKPDMLIEGYEKVARTVNDQCLFGSQSAELDDALACGQFYGEGVRSRKQRGLYGTAAAISILLGAQKSEYVATAKRLMQFVKHRQELEFGSRSESKLREDDLNTVKQANLLAALTPTIDEATFESTLRQKLMTARHDESGGWGFFLDEKSSYDVPTCYVVQALQERVSPDELTKTREYLWKVHQELTEKETDPDAIARRCLILFTLSKGLNATSAGTPSRATVTAAIKSLWVYARPLYSSRYELSIEFARQERNYYVRIPWQIYLAHALLTVQPKAFYARRIQAFLSELREASLSGGYAFAQAGQFTVVNTNRVVFWFLKEASTITHEASTWFNVKDWFGEFWAHPVKRFLTLGGAGILGLLISNSFKDELTSANPLWPNVIASLYVMLFSALYSFGRRGSP